MMALHSLTMPGKRLRKQTKWGVGLRGSVRVRTGDNLSNGLAHLLRPLACARVAALLMPKASARPLQPASCCFPHASPVSQTGAGKQKTAPQDRSKILISLRKFGRKDSNPRPQPWQGPAGSIRHYPAPSYAALYC